MTFPMFLYNIYQLLKDRSGQTIHGMNHKLKMIEHKLGNEIKFCAFIFHNLTAFKLFGLNQVNKFSNIRHNKRAQSRQAESNT